MSPTESTTGDERPSVGRDYIAELKAWDEILQDIVVPVDAAGRSALTMLLAAMYTGVP